MSLIKDAFFKAKELKKELPQDSIDRKSFLWNFITGEIKKQPDENLFDLRKIITKELNERARCRSVKGDVIG